MKLNDNNWIDDVIKQPMSVAKDPRGPSNAMMHYSRLWRNGKLYNVEVLYDKGNNKIFHYMYARDPLGPLPKIPGARK